jgi:hypothetical protein
MVDLAQDLRQIGFREDEQVGGIHAEAIGAHLDLLQRLFARDVEHALRAAKQHGQLEQQRRFADARVAADEHHAAGHDPATQHTAHLFEGHGHAFFAVAGDVGEGQRLSQEGIATVAPRSRTRWGVNE